jgi:uncharacterized protein
MPTNLPPEYFEVEKRYRAAQNAVEKVALLEELIGTVPKHKGTDKLRADLRRQLSRLKEEAQARKKHGGHHTSFHIEREGAGQVMLIGPANAGKSSLVSALTHAEPEVSPTPFTTWKPTPGMMEVEHVQVQLVDTPSTDREYLQPELFDLIRRADLLLLVADLLEDPLRQLDETLVLFDQQHIIPAQFKPDLASPVQSVPDRTVYLPLIVAINKYDTESLDELFRICCELLEGQWQLVPVSAITGRNLEQLKHLIFKNLDIIRVYAKPPGKEADLERPFALKRGSTVIDLAGKVHRDFLEKMKSARVWGSTAFAGQTVPRDYVLQDGDIVELRSQ